MSVNLNNSTDCCNTDCTNTTVNVPGPQGDAGAAGTNGTNGTNGYNGYSVTDAAFTIPSANTNTNIPVDQTGWIAATPTADTQIIFIGNAGHFLVSGKGTGHITGKPLFYTTDPGTVGQVIPAGTVVSPAGLQGPAGATGEASALLTAKGQLITRTSAAPAAISASGNGTALFTNTALNTGLEWKAINFTDVSGTVNPATHISDKSLPLAKLTGPSDAEGDLAYYNGTSWARLPKGSDGQILTVSGGAPTWVAASSSGLTAAVRTTLTIDASVGSVTADGAAINVSSASKVFDGSSYLTITVNFSSSVAVDLPIVIQNAGATNVSEYDITERTTGLVKFKTRATTTDSDRSISLMIFN